MKVEFRPLTFTDAARVSSRIHDYWIAVYSGEVAGGAAAVDVIFNREESPFQILAHMTAGQVYADVTLDGTVVGLISYRVNGAEFYIDKLYVDDGYRGIGIGTVCMDHMLEQARLSMCSSAALVVSTGNVAASAFYGRFGFNLEGYIQVDCGNGRVGHRGRMVKRL